MMLFLFLNLISIFISFTLFNKYDISIKLIKFEIKIAPYKFNSKMLYYCYFLKLFANQCANKYVTKKKILFKSKIKEKN